MSPLLLILIILLVILLAGGGYGWHAQWYPQQGPVPIFGLILVIVLIVVLLRVAGFL